MQVRIFSSPQQAAIIAATPTGARTRHGTRLYDNISKTRRFSRADADPAEACPTPTAVLHNFRHRQTRLSSFIPHHFILRTVVRCYDQSLTHGTKRGRNRVRGKSASGGKGTGYVNGTVVESSLETKENRRKQVPAKYDKQTKRQTIKAIINAMLQEGATSCNNACNDHSYNIDTCTLRASTNKARADCSVDCRLSATKPPHVLRVYARRLLCPGAYREAWS